MSGGLPSNMSKNPVSGIPDSSVFLCPNCKQTYSVGQLTCAQCGMMLGDAESTRTLDMAEVKAIPTRQPHGEALRVQVKPITLQIGATKLALPLSDQVFVGRQMSYADGPFPHVDLTAFGAQQRGVSRRHIKIVDRDGLAYIADMNSSNGSWLNGHRLEPYHEYLLHDGDDLRLGLLKIKIRF